MCIRDRPGEYMRLYARDCWCLHTLKFQELISKVFGATVLVDPNMDVEALKLYVEENRLAIAAELSAGNRAYADAQYLLKNYKSSIPSADRSALQSALTHLKTALRRESKGMLDLYTPPVRTLADSIWAGLGGSGPIPSGAEDAVSPEDEEEGEVSSGSGGGIHIG